MEDGTSRQEKKRRAREQKRKRIEESGGVRPRSKERNEDDRSSLPPNTDDKMSKRRHETTKETNKKPQQHKQQHQLHNSTSTSKVTFFKRGQGGAIDKTPQPPQQQRRGGNAKNNKKQQQHRFGRVMEQPPCTSKPRRHTLSIAIPGSIISNVLTHELRTYVVGQLARAATIYHVDEIVVYDDKLASEIKDRGGGYHHRKRKHERQRDDDGKEGDADDTNTSRRNDDDDGTANNTTRSKDPHVFLANLLQYCECPQYLRRHFFPMHPDLQFAGLLPPIDAPHHVRAGDASPYREGVVLDKRGPTNSGSLVNVGVSYRPVEIDRMLSAGVRCTVKMPPRGYYDGRGGTGSGGTVVSPYAPREEDGTYWGYATRMAGSLTEVFESCPFEGGRYDLKIGTSERGDVTVDDKGFGLPRFRHAMLVFGGVAGIEESVDADESLAIGGDEAKTLFDLWVNTCPFQGSRTIRTEEAVLLSLSRLRPYVSTNNIPDKPPEKPVKVEFSDESPSSEESSSEETSGESGDESSSSSV